MAGKKVWKKIVVFLMVLLIAGTIKWAGDEMGRSVAGRELVVEEKACKEIEGNFSENCCVVLDAGHGGSDPGKIGINGVAEKEVNLRITLRLKDYLEAAGVRVVLTRSSDEGLYEENASNKKVQDMKARIAIIEEADPNLAVSIHQNSYPEEEVHGAQVFYYETSVEGKKLAEELQRALRECVEPGNKRQAKGNTTYYLLKKTPVPLVIAECGFLSNPVEAQALCSEKYQDQIAYALALGICEYLK